MVWRGRGTVCLDRYGTIKVTADSVPHRLAEIYSRITGIMSELDPEAVAVEEVFYGKSFQSALRIGEARGVCLLAATQAGIPTFSYSAAEIKSAVTGNGRAHKSQVQAMVARLLGLEKVPRPADAADALACALCHSHRLAFGSLLGGG